MSPRDSQESSPTSQLKSITNVIWSLSQGQGGSSRGLGSHSGCPWGPTALTVDVMMGASSSHHAVHIGDDALIPAYSRARVLSFARDSLPTWLFQAGRDTLLLGGTNYGWEQADDAREASSPANPAWHVPEQSLMRRTEISSSPVMGRGVSSCSWLRDQWSLPAVARLQLSLTEQTLLGCLGSVGCLQAWVMPSRRLDSDRDRHGHHKFRDHFYTWVKY